MMNISLPETLKSFVDDQVRMRGYRTSSEYTRKLIRKDQDRQRLRSLFLDGTASSPTTTADAEYFDLLRDVCPHAVDGGEGASCVADGQHDRFRVDDDPGRPG